MTLAKTPFTEGNEWRFTKGKQPVRTPTLKQQSKILEKLLVMKERDVEQIANIEDNPVFLRFAAKSILQGNISRVVDIIAKYRSISNRKEVH